MRRIVRPLEALLVQHKRVVIKDSAVSCLSSVTSLCLFRLMLYAMVRRSWFPVSFDMTMASKLARRLLSLLLKERPSALVSPCYIKLYSTFSAIAQMTTSTIASVDHGVVAKSKRVIMERDVYGRKWGLGPVASKKKQMIKVCFPFVLSRCYDFRTAFWTNLASPMKKHLRSGNLMITLHRYVLFFSESWFHCFQKNKDEEEAPKQKKVKKEIKKESSSDSDSEWEKDYSESTSPPQQLVFFSLLAYLLICWHCWCIKIVRDL